MICAMKSGVEFSIFCEMSLPKVSDFGSFWIFKLELLNLHVLNDINISSLIAQKPYVSLGLEHMCLHTPYESHLNGHFFIHGHKNARK